MQRMQKGKCSFDLSLQDGKVEENIPSPELFPIHHLDEFEYFPGDFVVDAKGNLFTSDRGRSKTVCKQYIGPDLGPNCFTL